MIDGYLLASKQMVLTNGTSAVLNDRGANARSYSSGLFAKLAGSAATRMYNFAGGGTKFLVGDAVS